MHHNKLPDKIDHKDNNKSNNKIENLREATQSENRANAVVNKDNQTGYKGVNFRPNRVSKKYRARVQQKHIGWFETAIEAAKAYDEKALEIFGEYAKLNFERGIHIGN